MMVMITASTPSLKASRRAGFIPRGGGAEEGLGCINLFRLH